VGNGKFIKLNPAKFTCSACDQSDVEGAMSNTGSVEDQLSKIINKLDKLDTIQESLASLQMKITGTNGIQEKVEKALRDLEDMQQYTRINNLIISGIPDLEDLEPKQVVLDLANYLGVDIGLNNLDTAHRLPTKIKGKDMPTIDS